ncbi:MAG TPA: UvrD-helicase domain-containing protein [Rhodocyclaceae bacterium]|nr:UvrD-helicase domain-containing protein [Rhodocyclaceae bacterium]
MSFLQLQASSTPLVGIQAIEASAGTGKTWSIAALYLRLVLERALPVDRILVVTYTTAATAELKGRIRARLNEARDVFRSGDAVADPVLSALLERIDPARAETLLTLAIESFDLAAIHTIHGFCQRALAERAFESGQAFETELMTDQTPLLRETVRDLWRREMVVAGADPAWVAWLLKHLPGPDALLSALVPHLGKPYLRRLPPLPVDVTAAECHARAFADAREHWRKDGAPMQEMLCQWPGLSRTSYKPEQIAKHGAAVGAWLAQGGDAPIASITLFTPAKLQAGTNKGANTPEHPLFQTLEALLTSQQALEENNRRRYGHLLLAALDACETQLAERKAQLNRQSFDDLLVGLHDALHGTGGPALAAALRDRYGAALIDEFQDTDPIQYEIFRVVFGGSGVIEIRNGASELRHPREGGDPWPVAVDSSLDPRSGEARPVLSMSKPVLSPVEGGGDDEEGALFFVGDPKQAIYSFRGADLQAYLAARNDAEQSWLLDTNRRSVAPLVAAVNAVFARGDTPFLDERLPFVPVAPSPKPIAPLVIEGRDEAPLTFWFLRRQEADSKGKPKSINKGDANARIAQAVAAEIAELLRLGEQGAACIGERALNGGDMAVLVKSHRQGRLVREALAALNVASVRYGQDSVFDSREALDMERVLLAVAEPGRDGLLRAALTTDLFGLCGDDIAALDADPAAWDAWLQRFQNWHALARERGFIPMWAALQAEMQVPARLLALPEGERRMTNLQHLSELLQQQAHDEDLSLEALAKRLADARCGDSERFDSEAQQLRLESDEQLVKIVTIHASKGLEYPVVYCPFLWDGAAPKRQDALLKFHDDDHAAALDFGTSEREAHEGLAEEERRAELLRLAYVALTRAKHRCVLAWGGIKDAELSPLAWLIHGRVGEDFKKLSDDELLADLSALAEAARGSSVLVATGRPEAGLLQKPIAVVTVPDDKGIPWQPASTAAERLQALSFNGHIVPAWRTHSFTGWLASEIAAPVELPDHDALAAALNEELAEPAPDEPEVSGFPRGANAGSALHALLEHGDATPEAITARLAPFGIGAEWASVAQRLVQDVVSTPLWVPSPLAGEGQGKGSGAVRLADIPRDRRLCEMEFLFPIAAPDMAALSRAIGPEQGADGQLAKRVARLAPSQAMGFLKGFIDLVFEHDGRFHLLDYKSNWLGARYGDYGAEALAAAMAAENYDLQALLYAVALHRLQALRRADYDYDAHFGGAYYLFLRGMRPDVAGSGVFAWRPDQALAERVDACLARATDAERLLA